MLTMFTIPKPFRGLAAIHQRNALAVWRRLHPTVQVLVFGAEEGAEDACRELGCEYLPAIQRNEYGTPLLHDAFQQAEQRAQHPLLVYANADMLLLDDFLAGALAAQQAAPHGFLLIGRRTQLEVLAPLELSGEWAATLRAQARLAGQLDPPTATDYFVFPKGYLGVLPPFAVGRAAWDNWMLWHARQLGGPLIDGTADITAIHQRHDYGHVTGGAQRVFDGPEAQHNRALAGGYRHIWTQQDALHQLRGGVLHRDWSWRAIYRQLWQAARALRYRLRDWCGRAELTP